MFLKEIAEMGGFIEPKRIANLRDIPLALLQ